MKSPARAPNEFTERQYLETKARSIINKASEDCIPAKLFKPVAYISSYKFTSESQKSRYFKIMKELQGIKSRIITNPLMKYETCHGLILLHTRYIASREEISKFIASIMDERVVPPGMNLKETIFYMLTYDKNFDLAKNNEYTMKDQPKVSDLITNRSQKIIQTSGRASLSMLPSKERSNRRPFKSNKRLFSDNSSSPSRR
jgi:hypothetical protein